MVEFDVQIWDGEDWRLYKTFSSRDLATDQMTQLVYEDCLPESCVKIFEAKPFFAT